MSAPSAPRWMTCSQIPWLARTDTGGTVVQLCDRLLQLGVASTGLKSLLQQQLPEIATELAGQWAAVLERSAESSWKPLGEFGRHPLPHLPSRLFDGCIERGDAVHAAADGAAGWTIAATPLDVGTGVPTLLVVAGRNLHEGILSSILPAGRVVGAALSETRSRERHLARIDRLKVTLKLALTFAGARDTTALLELIAKESTRMLDCDRASIFVWDREHHQVVACPALGVEGGTLRLPDNVGVVGHVIHGGGMVRVDDAYSDSRFNPNVDKNSGYQTRNLLCGPMHDAQGKLIGAFEVINKNQGFFSADDEEAVEQLAMQAAIALQNTREREQLVRTREQLTAQVTRGVQIIGESASIVALRQTIGRLAATDLPVLVLGESGTGKEVVAQALHFQGPRAHRPFVAVNCAALTESLLESELFGHERGAFTDAREQRAGKFELAEGGTLFLDEIGDMSLGGQAKLLRVLEQKVVTRVGGSQSIPVNVRIVAATNANLPESVRNRKFREDLYFRLRVVPMELPPLRERPEDILLLAEHFLKAYCVQARRPTLHLSPDARRRLQAHNWPGNVRELRNLMERVAFLAAGDKVEVDDLSFILTPDNQTSLDPSPDMGLGEATRLFQMDYIRKAVKRVQGNMSEAARLMGLHRSNLYRKMRQLGMDEVGEFDE